MIYPLLEELIEADFDMLIADESARYIKNPTAKRTKASILLADNAKSKLILTGTPIANKPLDIWAQFRFMDGGRTFGNNFYSFRGRHFKKIKRKSKGRIYFEYKIRKTSIPMISNKIQGTCIRKRKEECFDLPEKIYSIIELRLTGELREIYETVQKKVVSEIETLYGSTRLNINNIFTKLLKLQQITSGFIKKENGSEEELKHTPKLDALIEEVETIVDAEESVIIWCRFLKSIDMIKKRLGRLQIKCITMQGSDKDKYELWHGFQTNDIPVFISQIQSGGIGIELFKENSTAKNQYTIFYENMWSLDYRVQAEDRTNRIGQNSTCVYKDIIVTKTIDEKILRAVQERQEIANLIMKEGVTKWLKH